MTRRRLPSPLAVLPALLLAVGCSSDYPRRAPLGEPFPSVSGQGLDGTRHRLPDDRLGEPTLLLIGYEQDTQFDLDRWLLGLRQAEIDVAVYELPTIPGLVPGLIAGKIDEGMRSGIPREDWAAVITVYDDAEAIARFTGNENRLPGRIVLLDADGKVAYFHDEGYSVSALMRLRDALEQLEGRERP